jgi:hypothetical protein
MCRLGYIAAFIEEIFLKIHSSNFPRMLYKQCKFGYNRPIIKGTLLDEQYTFGLYPVFHLSGFSDDSYIAISTHAL